ncbi:MAG: hypothetical protein WA160_05370 [Pseudobdellovibrio sp.]
MLEMIEQILGIYTISLYREGKRLVEIKTLTFFLKLMNGMRQLALLYYLSIIHFILLTAGVFIVVVQSINQYEKVGGIYLDPILFFGIAMTVLSLSFSFWLLNERRWIEALQLEHYFQPNNKQQTPKVTSEEKSASDQDALKDLISEFVEKKMKEMIKEFNKKTSTDKNPEQ